MLEIGLIGVGHWGPNLVRSFEQSGRAHVKRVCDLESKRLDLVESRYPGVITTQNLEDVLNDPRVDAIVISTPVHTHFEIAKSALEASKHVMVEKPITSSSAQAYSLIDTAKKMDRTLMVGHVFEYNASILALKKLVTSGELGSVQYMNFVRTNLGPVRTDVNALWDLASHDVSIMSFILEDTPVDVTARGQAYLNPNVEDAVFATFSFSSGVLANVNVSWLNPAKVRQITVVGDKKMAVWDDLDMQRPIQIYDRHVEVPSNVDSYLSYKTAVVDGGVYIPNISLNQPLQAECQHFIECIEKGTTPQSDGWSGLRVVHSLEAATISMQNDSQITEINSASQAR